MKFVNTRDLRQKTGDILKAVNDEDYIITSNGKPVAILSPVEADLDRQLQTLRRARAEAAVFNIQKRSAEKQLDQLTDEQIEAEIKAARKAVNR